MRANEIFLSAQPKAVACLPVTTCVGERRLFQSEANSHHPGDTFDARVSGADGFNLRLLEEASPLINPSLPSLLERLWHYIRRSRVREPGLIRRLLRHAVEESVVSLRSVSKAHRHLGSAWSPLMSSGRSEGSSPAMTAWHSSSRLHFGFSVFSSVTPCALVSLGNESTYDLVPEFWALVFPQLLIWQSEVVLE